jgi:hypothetical protein
MSEQCENCGRLIGALETPHIYEDHVVCRQCKDKLSVPRPPALPSIARPTEIRRASPPPPAYLETGHVPYAPSVNVHLPKRASSFGITSLILGIIAFLLCWLPLIGMLTIPLSLLGVIFGSIGLAVALRRQGSGAGYPCAGIAVGLFALLIGLVQVAVVGSAAHAISSPPTHPLNFSWPNASPQPLQQPNFRRPKASSP